MLNENDVVAAVCDYLKSQGYEIVQQCATTEQGIDIIARHPERSGRLLIEAKGGTSSREGSPRYDKGFSPSQVFDRVAKGRCDQGLGSGQHFLAHVHHRPELAFQRNAFQNLCYALGVEGSRRNTALRALRSSTATTADVTTS